MAHGITPEPPAGSEQYREGWRTGYEQAEIDVARARVPMADWSGSWAELTGYVDGARLDGGTIDPAQLADYLVELKRKALAPVWGWTKSTMGEGQ
jgi:hypothetical protein